MSDKPRAYTVEEMRKMFLDHIRSVKNYWLKDSRTPDVEDKMDGLVFSILNMFDGTATLPAFDIVPSPHPDDKEYLKKEGENWWEDEVINADCHLHDEWYATRRKQNSHPLAYKMWKMHNDNTLSIPAYQLLKAWEKESISQHEFERLAKELLGPNR